MQIFESWNNLHQRIIDSRSLLKVIQEEGDAGYLAELKKEFQSLSQDVRELEIKSFLNGEQDKSSAYFSIHSGAGGTEAQDWVSMLYRMYLKWAEKKTVSNRDHFFS